MSAGEVIGRDEELGELDAFLDAASTGPAALVLSGEAGIGKTLLWEAGVEHARQRGARVLPHRSVEAEAGFAFAGLSDLVAPVFDEVADELAVPRAARWRSPCCSPSRVTPRLRPTRSAWHCSMCSACSRAMLRCWSRWTTCSGSMPPPPRWRSQRCGGCSTSRSGSWRPSAARRLTPVAADEAARPAARAARVHGAARAAARAARRRALPPAAGVAARGLRGQPVLRPGARAGARRPRPGEPARPARRAHRRAPARDRRRPAAGGRARAADGGSSSGRHGDGPRRRSRPPATCSSTTTAGCASPIRCSRRCATTARRPRAGARRTGGSRRWSRRRGAGTASRAGDHRSRCSGRAELDGASAHAAARGAAVAAAELAELAAARTPPRPRRRPAAAPARRRPPAVAAGDLERASGSTRSCSPRRRRVRTAPTSCTSSRSAVGCT